MSMSNPLDSRQADPSAFKSLRRMEALEYAEQFIYIFHIETDPIIPNEHDDLIRLLVRASDFDLGWRTGASEFYRIRNQVDEPEP